MLWGPGILSFVVAFAALRLLIGPLARLALAEPNERSLPQRPVPRRSSSSETPASTSAMIKGSQ